MNLEVGRLIIVGGSTGLTGAACLSAMASLRCGCGLVTVACPKELGDIFEIKLNEAMTIPLPSEGGMFSAKAIDALKEKMSNSSAVLAGPGMGISDGVRIFAKDIIRLCRVPLIIDADGLNAIASDTDILKHAPCPVIITPHIGEFARLTGKTCDEVLKNKADYALEFAKEFDTIVVLKSHETIVVTPDGEVYENVLGNPGMATGGSGDVLSGAIASFAAQGCSPLLSCLAGVFFHSLSADMAAIKLGEYSLIAGDIINYLAYAIKETSEKY